MLSLVPASPAAPRPAPPADPTGDLLDGLGPLAGSHVLVLGGGPALLGGLVRRGCPEATMLRRGERPAAAAHDLVLVAQVGEADDLDRLVCQARRALVPTGGLVARLAGAGAEARAHRLALRLRLNGFVDGRTVPLAGAVLLRASLPAFGLGARP